MAAEARRPLLARFASAYGCALRRNALLQPLVSAALATAADVTAQSAEDVALSELDWRRTTAFSAFGGLYSGARATGARHDTAPRACAARGGAFARQKAPPRRVCAFSPRKRARVGSQRAAALLAVGAARAASRRGGAPRPTGRCEFAQGVHPGRPGAAGGAGFRACGPKAARPANNQGKKATKKCARALGVQGAARAPPPPR